MHTKASFATRPKIGEQPSAATHRSRADIATGSTVDNPGHRLVISSSWLASLVVGVAIATSTIVFSEPALADVLMMAVIVGVPLLGAARFGRVATVNLGVWLVIVALSLLAATMSVTLDTAAKHLFVTLYLVLGAFVLAGLCRPILSLGSAWFSPIMSGHVWSRRSLRSLAISGWFPGRSTCSRISGGPAAPSKIRTSTALPWRRP